MPQIPRWMGVLFVIGACVLFLAVAASAWSTHSFLKQAARAEGLVTALRAGPSHPEVEFELPSGEKVSFPANGFISYREGQRATVLYSPDEPFQSARLDDFGDLWMQNIIELLMAMISLTLGLRALITAR